MKLEVCISGIQDAGFKRPVIAGDQLLLSIEAKEINAVRVAIRHISIYRKTRSGLCNNRTKTDSTNHLIFLWTCWHNTLNLIQSEYHATGSRCNVFDSTLNKAITEV